MSEKWRAEVEKAIDGLIVATSLTSEPVERSKLIIELIPAPHKPSPLPAGKMATYGFWGDGSWLKIGKSGSKSNARYQSQHYNYKSASSTLAGSLRCDTDMVEIENFDPDAPGDWIRNHTHRLNILIAADKPPELLAFIEAFLHLKLRPRYER